MPAEEEGVHQMFRESGRRAGEPEQSPHRGTQEAERALFWKWGEVGMISYVLILTEVREQTLAGRSNQIFSRPLTRFDTLFPDTIETQEKRTFMSGSPPAVIEGTTTEVAGKVTLVKLIACKASSQKQQPGHIVRLVSDAFRSSKRAPVVGK